MSVLSKESTLAGVTDTLSNPFASMEINGQISGTNGIIQDTKPLSSGSGTAIRVVRKANGVAGIVSTGFEYLPSLAFGRAGL